MKASTKAQHEVDKANFAAAKAEAKAKREGWTLSSFYTIFFILLFKYFCQRLLQKRSEEFDRYANENCRKRRHLDFGKSSHWCVKRKQTRFNLWHCKTTDGTCIVLGIQNIFVGIQSANQNRTRHQSQRPFERRIHTRTTNSICRRTFWQMLFFLFPTIHSMP